MNKKSIKALTIATNKNIIYISPDNIESKKSYYFSNPNSNYPNREGYKAISEQIYKKYTKNLKNK